MFMWLEASGWRVPLEAGGLRDQPEQLLENVFRIKAVIESERRPKYGR